MTRLLWSSKKGFKLVFWRKVNNWLSVQMKGREVNICVRLSLFIPLQCANLFQPKTEAAEQIALNLQSKLTFASLIKCFKIDRKLKNASKINTLPSDSICTLIFLTKFVAHSIPNFNFSFAHHSSLFSRFFSLRLFFLLLNFHKI